MADAPGQPGYPLQQYPQAQVQPQVVVVQQGNQGVAPETNSIMAYISLLFCCPIGIFAVLRANEANACIGRGDFQGGKIYGEAAKKCAKGAIITGVVLGIVSVIGSVLNILFGTAAQVSSSYSSSYSSYS
ncbi:uncharacterized protein LOC134815784 isoform X2 [Bolinopsis microptera]|uniref:uncharacterized protein LOC134815784 isoform X2 n=1 Tax=Bolinopsis microptera TaxID=2820187 RepID=UPI00307A8333